MKIPRLALLMHVLVTPLTPHHLFLQQAAHQRKHIFCG